MAEIVVGISGASGIVLGHRTIQVLTALGHRVHLILSRAALFTAQEEMGSDFATPERFVSALLPEQRDRLTLHGMAIIPCSMGTLAAVAMGLSDNLLRRAADVTLKERRRLVIVPRETPLSEIHLDNMLRLTRMGGIIVPPMPAWYTKPRSLRDVEDFVVGRVLDLLGIDAKLYPRWGVEELPHSNYV